MATQPPKVISIRTSPVQASYLCFGLDGILEQVPAALGASAQGFPFSGFYSTMSGNPTVAGDPSRLLYNPSQIQEFTNPFTLATLRAEPARLP